MTLCSKTTFEPQTMSLSVLFNTWVICFHIRENYLSPSLAHIASPCLSYTPHYLSDVRRWCNQCTQSEGWK